MSTTTNKPKTRRAAHHDRQVAAGKALYQGYVDVELRARLGVIAAKRGVTLQYLFEEMIEDFCDREAFAEAEMIRALFAGPPTLEAA